MLKFVTDPSQPFLLVKLAGLRHAREGDFGPEIGELSGLDANGQGVASEAPMNTIHGGRKTPIGSRVRFPAEQIARGVLGFEKLRQADANFKHVFLTALFQHLLPKRR